MDAPQEAPDPVTFRALARVGSVLRGKWRLDGLLGVGGMAAVYRGTHRNGKRGAVKMLHLELSTDGQARARFLREGYAANSVEHPGAVSVLDDDVAEDGSVFLVMELLEGHTVAARAESRPGSKLEPGEVLAIADQLLDALAAAHRKGIVHRDLKPENLFLTREGQVKVLDFGLASLHDLSRSKARMTANGYAMGTPAFMPPEQALGNWDAVDARTDLWAVGATLFTILTGRFVHQADTINKLFLAAMTQPAPRLSTVEPRVPAAIAAIVDKALAFDAKDRWPDAATMREAVRRARAQIRGEIGAERPSAPIAVGATILSVEPVQRSAESSSLGPTSSEPRLRVGAKGVLATALVVGALAGAVIYMATRGSAPVPVTAIAPPSVSAAPAQGAAPVVTATAAVPVVTAASTDAAAASSAAASASAQPPAPPSTGGALRPGRSLSPAAPRASAAPRPTGDPMGKW